MVHKNHCESNDEMLGLECFYPNDDSLNRRYFLSMCDNETANYLKLIPLKTLLYILIPGNYELA
jgi:hypothetical protein